MRYLYNSSQKNEALTLYSCGFDTTAPGHSYGPTVRSGYMLHYVISGTGTFTICGKSHILHKGDLFFIEPGTLIKYEASSLTPWSFYWMGFRGTLIEEYFKRCAISAEFPVFTEKQAGIIKDLFMEIVDISIIENDVDVLLNAKLLELIYHLCRLFPALERKPSGSARKKLFIQAIEYIRNHYESDMKIEDVSGWLNIDRTYLHRLFKKQINMSPKGYLTQVRINKAKSLLLTTTLPVAMIAQSVGYRDALLFSKTFRQQEACTPSDFRRQNRAS